MNLILRTCLMRTGYLPQREFVEENKRTEERFRKIRGWLEASCSFTKRGEKSLLAEANADSPGDIRKVDEYERENREGIMTALGSNADAYNLVRETSVRQGKIKLYLERVL